MTQFNYNIIYTIGSDSYLPSNSFRFNGVYIVRNALSNIRWINYTTDKK